MHFFNLSPNKEYNKQQPHSEIFGIKQNALTLNITSITGLVVGMWENKRRKDKKKAVMH